MNGQDDPLHQQFEGLDDQARARVHVESSLAELHGRGHRPRWRTPVLGAAAVVLVAAVAGTLVWSARDNGSAVTAAGPGDSPLTFDVSELCEDLWTVVVYLRPDATDGEIAQLSGLLGSFVGPGGVVFSGGAATATEFGARNPENTESEVPVDPAQLPASLSIVVHVGTDSPTVEDRIVQRAAMGVPLAGVEQVESFPWNTCPYEGSVSTEGYSVLIDGELVDPELILQAQVAEAVMGSTTSSEMLNRTGASAVASAAANEVFADHGRQLAEPVTEADIDDAIDEADSVWPLVAPDGWDGSTDAQWVRDSVRRGVERSRGSQAVVADGDPTLLPQERLRRWLVAELARRNVVVEAPSGPVNHETIGELYLPDEQATTTTTEPGG